jgi:hypothetical protein
VTGRVSRWCAVALVVSALAGCGGEDEVDTKQTDGAVCRLVDRALVAEVVGGDVETTGPGAVSREARTTGVSHCSITAADAREPVIQVRVGDVDGEADTWRTTLEDEAAQAGVPLSYQDPSWFGYTRDHTSGTYNPGSSLAVVTDEHVIRVTIYRWAGSTHTARVDLAERIAHSAEENQATFDREG